MFGARDLVLSARAGEVAPAISVGRIDVARVEEPRVGEAVVVAGTNFQQKLEAAKRDAAAAAERAAKLDAAEAGLLRQATADWASAKSLVDGGGGGAKAAAEAFIEAYGAAKVKVDGEERVVVISEVEIARTVAKVVVVSSVATPSAGGGAAGADFESPTLGTMKWIPAGTFLMGSPSSEVGRGDEETQHEVTLTKGYWMMEHEVTQGEYEAVMGTNPSHFATCGSTCPVGRLSWNVAVVFARAASVRDGVAYRLPTEAEWERAARGGRSGELYAGGGEVNAAGWTRDNSESTPHPVCQKRRNAYGLCDMTGNESEWTSDWYGPYTGSSTDPQGATSGSGRVFRGGAWYNQLSWARVAMRDGSAPSGANFKGGFRLIRPAP